MNKVILQTRLKQLNWLIVVITMLVFLLLIKLGFWQSERAIEKEQRLLRITQLSEQQALPLETVLALENMSDGINDVAVSLTGEFDDKSLFFLDNQTNSGRLGYRVLQVFYHGEYAVLVNLGWVIGSIDRNELPQIETIKGEHQLLGHVREIEMGIQLMAQNFAEKSWPIRIQQIEIDKFSTLTNRPLLPFVIMLDKDQTIGYEKNWQPIVMPPEKHRAYAFQWFSLAAAWLILMLWAASKAKNRHRH